MTRSNTNKILLLRTLTPGQVRRSESPQVPLGGAQAKGPTSDLRVGDAIDGGNVSGIPSCPQGSRVNSPLQRDSFPSHLNFRCKVTPSVRTVTVVLRGLVYHVDRPVDGGRHAEDWRTRPRGSSTPRELKWYLHPSSLLSVPVRSFSLVYTWTYLDLLSYWSDTTRPSHTDPPDPLRSHTSTHCRYVCPSRSRCHPGVPWTLA